MLAWLPRLPTVYAADKVPPPPDQNLTLAFPVVLSDVPSDAQSALASLLGDAYASMTFTLMDNVDPCHQDAGVVHSAFVTSAYLAAKRPEAEMSLLELWSLRQHPRAMNDLRTKKNVALGLATTYAKGATCPVSRESFDNLVIDYLRRAMAGGKDRDLHLRRAAACLVEAIKKNPQPKCRTLTYGNWVKEYVPYLQLSTIGALLTP
jgi:hypothetical protein